MKAPSWMIRNILYTFGARPPKFRPTLDLRDEGRCDKCRKIFRTIQEKNWRSGHYYCDECVKNIPLAAMGPGFFSAGQNYTYSEAGNLEDWEYRFWVGMKHQQATYSLCKCCRTVVHGKNDRADHKKHWGETEDSCMKRLQEAYKLIKKEGNCVCCKKKTYEEKWGLPLCSRVCQAEWKFSDTNWLILRAALKTLYPQMFQSSGSEDSGSTWNPIEQSRRLSKVGGS